MHAGAPASAAQGGDRQASARRAGDTHALRRRRRDLQRRPFLHPALRLSVAHREAQSRSAAHRSGGERRRELRRMRAVWRGRRRGRAVPVGLSRRDHSQCGLVGARLASVAPRHHRLVQPPCRGDVVTPAERPIAILIAALGGEGGGVLTNWIVAAAAGQELPVQSTSIPGVAQRTGATTYYIEIVPTPWRDLGGRRPVMGLSPGAGDVDLVVASELLEAGRAIAGGFVTPDRTLLIASTHRSHAIAEKIAMGDGRFDTVKLMGAAQNNARSHVLFDMDAVATAAHAMINSVMMGAVAASGRLPIPIQAFEAAIRAGKSSEANLRGFRAGIEAAGRIAAEPGSSSPSPRLREAGDLSPQARRGPGYGDSRSPSFPEPDINLEREAARFGAAAGIVAAGLRRLVAYQDIAYARLYLDRLTRIAEADARDDARGQLTREVARHLALRMSYEDVIRVAEAKIAPERLARIFSQMNAKHGEPVTIVEFLKPGIEEMCSILPSWIARPVIAAAERRGWIDKFHWA